MAMIANEPKSETLDFHIHSDDHARCLIDNHTHCADCSSSETQFSMELSPSILPKPVFVGCLYCSYLGVVVNFAWRKEDQLL